MADRDYDMLKKEKGQGGMQVQLLKAYTNWLDDIGMFAGAVDIAELVAEFTNQRFEQYVKEMRG